MQSHIESPIRLREVEGGVEALCPAKINLFLEVVAKREDGFHEIETVVQFVDLYDRILFEPSEGIEVLCSEPSLPADQRNLIWRVAEALGVGVRATVEKRIPVGGGMGGGSSDAAGALLALDKLYGLRLPRERMLQIASSLGADIAMFFYTGTLLCRGIGDVVERVKGCKLYYVVLYPGWCVETRKVYASLGRLTESCSCDKILEGLRENSPRQIGENLFNRLIEGAMRVEPRLGGVKRKMECCQLLLGSSMSGSGSCVFGLAGSERSASRCARSLERAGRVFVLCSVAW